MESRDLPHDDRVHKGTDKTDKNTFVDILSVLSVQNTNQRFVDPSAEAPLPEPNPDQIHHFCQMLLDGENGCLELRVIGYQNGGHRPRNGVGFYRDTDAIIQTALTYHAKADVYIGLNPRPASFLRSREANRLHFEAAGAKDGDILSRRWLLIDIDTKRPGRKMATTRAELNDSHQVLEIVSQFLLGRGITPIQAMSGNGWHILVPTIDYTETKEPSSPDPFSMLLRWLAQHFNNEHAEIDTTTYNAGRVCKLYGIAAIKGNNTVERPYRTAVFEPSALPLVRHDILKIFQQEIAEQISREFPVRESKAREARWWKGYCGDLSTLDIVALFQSSSLYRHVLAGSKHVVVCPWSHEHTTGHDGDSSTVIFEAEPGRWPAFDCKHQHCQGRGLEQIAQFFGAAVVADHCRKSYQGNRSLPPSTHHPLVQRPGDLWPTRKPLPASLGPAPTMPASLIPEPIRTWVVDTAERIGVRYECVAVPAISALAIVIGRKVGICPKKYDSDWVVMTSVLWSAIVARSGTKKTAAISAALKPLSHLEKMARAEHAARQKANGSRQQILTAKIEGLMADIRKSRNACRRENLEKEHQALTAELEELGLTAKRYTTQDATVESLSQLLSQNPSGMGVIVDELVSWIRGLERKGHEAARGFYLKAWSGTESDTVDRIGRGNIHVDALFLVLTGGIQPDVIKPYIRDSMQGGKGNDGLLQRFQLLVVPDTSEPLPAIDREPDRDAYRAVLEIFQKIDGLTASMLGAAAAEGSDIATLHFSDEAQALFNGFIAAFEAMLCKTESPAVESHLAKNRATAPALALVFCILSWASGHKTSGVIEAPEAQRAIDWTYFLKEHMLRAYELSAHGDIKAAVTFARKIEEGKVTDGMALRDLYRPCWADLATKAAVEAAVSILEELHWLRLIDEGGKGAPGRPSAVVRLHPDFRKLYSLSS